ncbi:MAG TPA: hypothetical protein ENL41_02045 [candidate division WOR-3 bacterium]|uniref:Uncharacterized protein n=1 Tax=candidate division WOR-3 bacterium TaxID=2052148 RepID=A0A7C5I4L0_UNCW3|nr:hypothetical protein [candidate division WOR-3 bacterium]
MFKKIIPTLFLIIITSCQKEEFKQLVVSAQLSATKLDTLNVNIALAVVTEASLDISGESCAPSITPPEPQDTAFDLPDLPAGLEPVEGAKVVFAGDTLDDIGGGYYQGSPDSLIPLTRYNISIDTPDGSVSGSVILPGEFNIVEPSDTVIFADSLKSLNVVWTHSDSASSYMVRLVKIGEGVLYSEVVSDTTLLLDSQIFGASPQGNYLISVTAIYGKFESGIPGYSNLQGATGYLSAALTPDVVVVRIQ